MEQDVLLRFEGVDVTFGKVRAVKNVSFQIRRGETFSLVGESGSGKSTLGRAVMGLCPCAAGQILYKGQVISGKKRSRGLLRQIQMVFQDPASSLNERATVEYILSEGLRNFKCYSPQKVRDILQQVGLLPEHLHRYPHEFSGGQRQRIALARAMVMEPELVIADEPISALDVSVRAQVLNLMQAFQARLGTAYLFIAHDLSVVRFFSHRIGVIYKGELVEVAPAEVLFENPLHPYTKSLISAIPIPDPVLERSKVILPYTPPEGEALEMPTLREVESGHWVRMAGA